MLRAKIILHAAAGLRNPDIAADLGTDREGILRSLTRFVFFVSQDRVRWYRHFHELSAACAEEFGFRGRSEGRKRSRNFFSPSRRVESKILTSKGKDIIREQKHSPSTSL